MIRSDPLSVALDADDRVDQMLERPRTGELAVLRDVTDDEQRDAGLLGDRAQPFGHVANLRHRAGDARERVVAHRRDRIDHAQCRSSLAHQLLGDVDVRRGRDLELRSARRQDDGPAGRLGRPTPRRRSSSTGVERRGQLAKRHQRERRFAHARFTEEQRRRARDEAAAEDPVQFADAGRVHAARRSRRRRATTSCVDATRGFAVRSLLVERVPLATARTTTAPARRRRAAFATDVHGVGLHLR